MKGSGGFAGALGIISDNESQKKENGKPVARIERGKKLSVLSSRTESRRVGHPSEFRHGFSCQLIERRLKKLEIDPNGQDYDALAGLHQTYAKGKLAF